MTVNSESASTHSSSQVQEEHYVGNFGTFMHLIRSNIGVGILTLPWAVKNAGIIVGPVLLIVLGIVSSNAMVSLVKCSRHLSRKLGLRSMDYGDVVYYSIHFGPVKCLQRHAWLARKIINGSLMLVLLGSCSAYLVFIGQNVRQVFAVYWSDAPEDRAFIAMAMVPAFLLTLVKSLKKLSWLSGAGNIFQFVALCMICRYLFTHLNPIESRPYAAEITQLPLFLGVAVGTYEGIGLVLPVENAMRKPEDFHKVFYVAFAFITALYTFSGFTGYLTFGAATCGSISLNLPIGVVFYDTIRILYSVVLFITYTLMFYVPMEIVWGYIEKKCRPQKSYLNILTRALLVIFTGVVSILIPYFEDFLALFGSSIAVLLQFISPQLIEIFTFHKNAGVAEYPEHTTETTRLLLPKPTSDDSESAEEGSSSIMKSEGLSTWTILKNCIILIFGFITMISGTIVSVQTIIHDLETYSPDSTCSGGISTNSPFNLYNDTTMV